MTKMAFVKALSPEERDRLLSDPYSELRVTYHTHEDVILYHELSPKQLFWLAKELRYRTSSGELRDVLETIYRDEPLYQMFLKSKRDGGTRKILVPSDSLKEVQKRVLKYLLPLYSVPSSCAFGYSRGSIFDAIRPHVESGNQALFCTDVVDAFSSVRFSQVFRTLYGLGLYDSYKDKEEKGYLTWEVAFALCRIVTCGERLPQGAPTSPVLFDLVFSPIDYKLEHLAERVGGVYTRFADNIYFSMPGNEIPGPIARAIIRAIQGSRDLAKAYMFECHKTRTITLGEEAVRILGVNVMNGKILPTRQLKRRIRLSMHRVRWLLSQPDWDSDEFLKCWRLLQGQMSFARQAELPGSLIAEYEEILALVESIR